MVRNLRPDRLRAVVQTAKAMVVAAREAAVKAKDQTDDETFCCFCGQVPGDPDCICLIYGLGRTAICDRCATAAFTAVQEYDERADKIIRQELAGKRRH